MCKRTSSCLMAMQWNPTALMGGEAGSTTALFWVLQREHRRQVRWRWEVRTRGLLLPSSVLITVRVIKASRLSVLTKQGLWRTPELVCSVTWTFLFTKPMISCIVHMVELHNGNRFDHLVLLGITGGIQDFTGRSNRGVQRLWHSSVFVVSLL